MAASDVNSRADSEELAATASALPCSAAAAAPATAAASSPSWRPLRAGSIASSGAASEMTDDWGTCSVSFPVVAAAASAVSAAFVAVVVVAAAGSEGTKRGARCPLVPAALAAAAFAAAPRVILSLSSMLEAPPSSFVFVCDLADAGAVSSLACTAPAVPAAVASSSSVCAAFSISASAVAGCVAEMLLLACLGEGNS